MNSAFVRFSAVMSVILLAGEASIRAVAADMRQSRELHQEALAHAGFDDPSRAQEAIRMLSEAIGRSPNSADLFFTRGLIELRSGLPDEAIRDISQAITLLPTSDRKRLWYVSQRGLAYDLKGAFEKAEADYAMLPFGKMTEVPRVRQVIIKKRRDRHSDLEDFRAWAREFPRGFPRVIYQFIAGDVSEAELFKAAREGFLGRKGRIADLYEFQAYYYAGMERLSKGDKHTARSYFEHCLEKHFDFDEFYLARAELSRLNLE